MMVLASCSRPEMEKMASKVTAEREKTMDRRKTWTCHFLPPQSQDGLGTPFLVHMTPNIPVMEERSPAQRPVP
jgi:hypothetical protein